MTNLILSLVMVSIAVTLAVFRIRYRRQTVLQAAEMVRTQLARREPSDPGVAQVRPVQVYPLSDDMIKDLAWVYGYRYIDDTLQRTRRYLRFEHDSKASERGSRNVG